MELSPLESCLTRDLAQDSHGLWEVFEFVGLHYLTSFEPEGFNRGRELVASWLSRGWLRVDGGAETAHRDIRKSRVPGDRSPRFKGHDGVGTFLGLISAKELSVMLVGYQSPLTFAPNSGAG